MLNNDYSTPKQRSNNFMTPNSDYSQAQHQPIHIFTKPTVLSPHITTLKTQCKKRNIPFELHDDPNDLKGLVYSQKKCLIVIQTPRQSATNISYVFPQLFLFPQEQDNVKIISYPSKLSHSSYNNAKDKNEVMQLYQKFFQSNIAGGKLGSANKIKLRKIHSSKKDIMLENASESKLRGAKSSSKKKGKQVFFEKLLYNDSNTNPNSDYMVLIQAIKGAPDTQAFYKLSDIKAHTDSSKKQNKILILTDQQSIDTVKNYLERNKLDKKVETIIYGKLTNLKKQLISSNVYLASDDAHEIIHELSGLGFHQMDKCSTKYQNLSTQKKNMFAMSATGEKFPNISQHQPVAKLLNSQPNYDRSQMQRVSDKGRNSIMSNASQNAPRFVRNWVIQANPKNPQQFNMFQESKQVMEGLSRNFSVISRRASKIASNRHSRSSESEMESFKDSRFNSGHRIQTQNLGYSNHHQTGSMNNANGFTNKQMQEGVHSQQYQKPKQVTQFNQNSITSEKKPGVKKMLVLTKKSEGGIKPKYQQNPSNVIQQTSDQYRGSNRESIMNIDDPFYQNANMHNSGNLKNSGSGFIKVKNSPLQPVQELTQKRTYTSPTNQGSAQTQYYNKSSEHIIFADKQKQKQRQSLPLYSPSNSQIKDKNPVRMIDGLTGQLVGNYNNGSNPSSSNYLAAGGSNKPIVNNNNKSNQNNSNSNLYGYHNTTNNNTVGTPSSSHTTSNNRPYQVNHNRRDSDYKYGEEDKSRPTLTINGKTGELDPQSQRILNQSKPMNNNYNNSTKITPQHNNTNTITPQSNTNKYSQVLKPSQNIHPEVVNLPSSTSTNTYISNHNNNYNNQQSGTSIRVPVNQATVSPNNNKNNVYSSNTHHTSYEYRSPEVRTIDRSPSYSKYESHTISSNNNINNNNRIPAPIVTPAIDRNAPKIYEHNYQSNYRSPYKQQTTNNNYQGATTITNNNNNAPNYKIYTAEQYNTKVRNESIHSKDSADRNPNYHQNYSKEVYSSSPNYISYDNTHNYNSIDSNNRHSGPTPVSNTVRYSNNTRQYDSTPGYQINERQYKGKLSVDDIDPFHEKNNSRLGSKNSRGSRNSRGSKQKRGSYMERKEDGKRDPYSPYDENGSRLVVDEHPVARVYTADEYNRRVSQHDSIPVRTNSRLLQTNNNNAGTTTRTYQTRMVSSPVRQVRGDSVTQVSNTRGYDLSDYQKTVNQNGVTVYRKRTTNSIHSKSSIENSPHHHENTTTYRTNHNNVVTTPAIYTNANNGRTNYHYENITNNSSVGSNNNGLRRYQATGREYANSPTRRDTSVDSRGISHDNPLRRGNYVNSNTGNSNTYANTNYNNNNQNSYKNNSYETYETKRYGVDPLRDSSENIKPLVYDSRSPQKVVEYNTETVHTYNSPNRHIVERREVREPRVQASNFNSRINERDSKKGANNRKSDAQQTQQIGNISIISHKPSEVFQLSDGSIMRRNNIKFGINKYRANNNNKQDESYYLDEMRSKIKSKINNLSELNQYVLIQKRLNSQQAIQRQKQIYSYISTAVNSFHFLIDEDLSHVKEWIKKYIKTKNDQVETFTGIDELYEAMNDNPYLNRSYDVGLVFVTHQQMPKLNFAQIPQDYFIVQIFNNQEKPNTQSIYISENEKKVTITKLPHLKLVQKIVMEPRLNHIILYQKKGKHNQLYMKEVNYLLQLFPDSQFVKEYYQEPITVGLIDGLIDDPKLNRLYIICDEKEMINAVQQLNEVQETQDTFSKDICKVICVPSDNKILNNQSKIEQYPNVAWMTNTSQIKDYKSLIKYALRQDEDDKVYQTAQPLERVFYHSRHRNIAKQLETQFPSRFEFQAFHSVNQVEDKISAYKKLKKNKNAKNYMILHPSLSDEYLDLKLFKKIFMLGKSNKIQKKVIKVQNVTQLVELLKQ